ncbi:C1 family peptidase [Ralstonia solanacearum]|uniref:C1 family peptidase n=1 Tax=Ralstonia solanacearum TaxID=305 RepID=UPI0009BDBEDA|nr:C1 family peptidase [Ralstonia solanacearum]
MQETILRYRLAQLASVFITASIGWSTAPAQVATAPDSIISRFKPAEDAAPSAAKADLQALRERGKQAGWKFAVGYTSAFAMPLKKIAATRIPDNFLALAIAQNELAAKTNSAADESARLAGVTPPEFLAPCDPDAVAFNWRDQNMISDPQSQGAYCGSCWAFTAAATYDAAYRIRNKLPVAVSEQHILNCAVDQDGSKAGSCDGGWYDPVFRWMFSTGAATNAQMPYQGVVQPCAATQKGSFRAVSSGYVTTKYAIPLTREIKQSICRYGAISAAIEATTAFQAYTGGYFNERSNGPINHAVTIVGWNDNAGGVGEGAWLVKNSWGTDWGEKGFIWVDYQSNKIGYAATWVRPIESGVPVPAKALASAWAESVPRLQAAQQVVDPSINTLGKAVLPFQAYTDDVSGAKKTVWIQYGNSDQKGQAQALREQFSKAGYFAPAVEDVSRKGGKVPNQFQVRYFRESDKQVATRLAAQIASSGFGSPKVVRLAAPTGVDSIEVWFPRVGK